MSRTQLLIEGRTWLCYSYHGGRCCCCCAPVRLLFSLVRIGLLCLYVVLFLQLVLFTCLPYPLGEARQFFIFSLFLSLLAIAICPSFFVAPCCCVIFLFSIICISCPSFISITMTCHRIVCSAYIIITELESRISVE